MKPHMLHLHFSTPDDSDLHELIRLSLALCKLFTSEIDVDFIVERSEELDNLKMRANLNDPDYAPEPF